MEQKRIAHDGHVYLCCLARRKGKWVPARPTVAGDRQYWTETHYIPGASNFPWDGSKASIGWDRWEMLRGRRMAVFDYAVKPEDSHWTVTEYPAKARVPYSNGIPYSGPVDVRDSFNAPYSGIIWVDPETGDQNDEQDDREKRCNDAQGVGGHAANLACIAHKSLEICARCRL